MEMNVIVSTRTVKPEFEESLGVKFCSREHLLKNSDIVSIHCPGGAETKNLVCKEFLDQMKSNAVLLNTSRGSVINDADLLAHINA